MKIHGNSLNIRNAKRYFCNISRWKWIEWWVILGKSYTVYDKETVSRDQITIKAKNEAWIASRPKQRKWAGRNLSWEQHRHCKKKHLELSLPKLTKRAIKIQTHILWKKIQENCENHPTTFFLSREQTGSRNYQNYKISKS